MWFDVTAALAEIEGGAKPAPEARPPATPATPATQTPDPRPVSRLSRVSQAPETSTADPVAIVASVATPCTAPGAPNGAEWRYGRTVAGAPLTWTGRPVTPGEWRKLTGLERHGPDGRLWCGCCRAWVQRETALAHADARRAEWLARKAQA